MTSVVALHAFGKRVTQQLFGHHAPRLGALKGFKGLGEGDRTAPDLIQWLAAADMKHFTPLITACLERLGGQQSAAALGTSLGIDESSAMDQGQACRSAARCVTRILRLDMSGGGYVPLPSCIGGQAWICLFFGRASRSC